MKRFLYILALGFASTLIVLPVALAQVVTPATQGQPVSFTTGTFTSSVTSPIITATSAFVAPNASVYRTTSNGTNPSNNCGFNTGDECNFTNAIGASAANATTPAFKFYHTNGALDSTDALLDVGDNSVSKLLLTAGGHLDILGANAGNFGLGFTSGTNGICFNGSGSAGCSLGMQWVSGTGVVTFTTTSGRVDFSVGATVAQGQRLGLNGSSNSVGLVYNGSIITAEAPLSSAFGTGATVGALNGTLTVDTTANGNAADTTEDNLTAYSVPANTLTTNGRGLHLVFWGDNNAGVTADVETIRCYYGHATVLKSGTLLVTRVLTASQANTWSVVADVVRTGAATQVANATLNQGGTAVATVQTNSSPIGTLSGATLVGCTGQRATTSSANSVRQLGLIVTAF